MTSDDTLAVAAKVYKFLNMTAADREQAFGALQIIHTLLNLDMAYNDTKPGK